MKSRLLASSLRDAIQRHDSSHVIAINDDTFPILTATDLFLGDGCSECLEMHRRFPAAKFVLVDPGYEDEQVIYLIRSYHFDGVLSPDFDPKLLGKALTTIHEGQLWLAQKHLKGLVESHAVSEHPHLEGLTDQERRIIELVVKGKRNREIADQLCLCEQTIKGHVSRIYRKLNVSNRAQLVRLAMNQAAPSLQ